MAKRRIVRREEESGEQERGERRVMTGGIKEVREKENKGMGYRERWRK